MVKYLLLLSPVFETGEGGYSPIKSDWFDREVVAMLLKATLSR